jgi:hypothetical protein
VSSLLLLVAAGLALGELPPQPMPPGSGCAIFLWTRTEPPRRIAMISEQRGTVRISIQGQTVELARTGTGLFAGAGVTVGLDVSLDGDPSGAVAGGVLRIMPDGQEEHVIPVGGLRGCN